MLVSIKNVAWLSRLVPASYRGVPGSIGQWM